MLLIEVKETDSRQIRAYFAQVESPQVEFIHIESHAFMPTVYEMDCVDVILLPRKIHNDQHIQEYVNSLLDATIVVPMDNADISQIVQEIVHICLLKNQFNATLLEETIDYAQDRKQLTQTIDFMQQEMAASKDSLERLVANTNDGIVVVDSSGKVCLVNSTAHELLGESGTDILGLNDCDFNSGAKSEVGELNNVGGNRSTEIKVVNTQWQGESARMVFLRDVTEQKRALAELAQTRKTEQFFAYHDSLTSLPNRQLLMDRLGQTMARAKRYAHQFAVLFIDMDGFQEINNSLGHEIGDAVLKKTADRLQKALRKSDTVARYGGDEFFVVLDRLTDSAVAYKVGRKFADLIAQPMQCGDYELNVSASVGISLFPDDGQKEGELMTRAVKAMYDAKREGPSGCRYFNKTLEESNGEIGIFEQSLDRAIRNGELTPYFQPQISLASGKIVGFEALVRWIHPEKGIIAPADFIPLAEKHGLINKIDEFMLRSACRQIKKWEDSGYGALRISVNVNANLFRKKRLLKLIAEVIEETGLMPKQLCLEITETQVMQNVENTIKILSKLRAMHVGLAIDDFGTGYSSLSYLKRFPVDILKIDRAFLEGVPNDHENVAITTAIVALAKSMALEVVAEGLEEPEQLEFLQNLNCDEVQGFLVGRPGSVDAITKLLRSDYCMYAHL